VKFVAGDWDNEADENVIESVTLTYDVFERSGVREHRQLERGEIAEELLPVRPTAQEEPLGSLVQIRERERLARSRVRDQLRKR
jgi:hypothetical protein